jgi:hypothetical protein
MVSVIHSLLFHAKSGFAEADVDPFPGCGAACKMRLAVKLRGSEDIRSVGLIG